MTNTIVHLNPYVSLTSINSLSPSPSFNEGTWVSSIKTLIGKEVWWDHLIKHRSSSPEESTIHPLKYLRGMTYPIGLIAEKADDWFDRILGYFPIFGFYNGLKEMALGINLLYHRCIQNRNDVGYWSIEKNPLRKEILRKVTYFKTKLCWTQRLTLLAFGLALFIRGVLTFLQLGVLFLPFDLLFDSLKTRNHEEIEQLSHFFNDNGLNKSGE